MNIYLDNAATTPVDPRVTKAMFEWQNEYFGNPSSPHKHGQESKIKLENVRDRIAEKLNCLSKEIIFTSGGTESNNKAIIGAALANQKQGKHLILSGVEHPSVLSAATYLEKQGFKISHINPDSKGLINLEEFKGMINPDTALVSVMYVNNETGVIFPIQEIIKICKEKNIIFHCDAVQAFGKFEINVSELAVDMMTFSAHKIHGPKGTGGLFIRDGIAVDELAFGGGQEANRRAGTENLTGIIGLGQAIEVIQGEGDKQKVSGFSKTFETLISKNISDTFINGVNASRSPYISNISFIGVDNQSLLLKLDLNGVSASVGSACSSGSIKQSHVLRAMNLTEEIISSSIRFSFSRYNTIEEIEKSAQIIKKVVTELRS